MGTVRLGKRTENRVPLIKDFVPLTDINNLVFGGWDIFDDSVYDSAKNVAVLSDKHIESVKDFLIKIKYIVLKSNIFHRRGGSRWTART